MSKLFEKDFNKFVSEESAIPQALSKAVLSKISRELNPSFVNVFLKLFAIHTVMSLVTLSICQQFGISLIGSGMTVMRVFMFLGEYGCQSACGFFYLGMTFLIACLWLKPEEIKVMRANRFASAFALALVSLGVFSVISEGIAIAIGLAWLIGAVTGGLLLLELGFRARSLRLVR